MAKNSKAIVKKTETAIAETGKQSTPGPLRFRDKDEGGLEQVTPPDESAAAVRRMLGVSDSDTLRARFLGQVLSVMKPLLADVIEASDANDAAELLHNIAPQDAVEGMLAVQMIGAHSAAMHCLQLASLNKQTFEGRELNLKHATKLLRTYTAQVEALTKYRNKAKQTVIVKHVHVHEGGQAIVGLVDQGGGGKE